MLGVGKTCREIKDRIYEIKQDRELSKTENEKLRELCEDMWTYITEPVSKRNNLKERLARLDDIGDRMRKLGIEVGE